MSDENKKYGCLGTAIILAIITGGFMLWQHSAEEINKHTDGATKIFFAVIVIALILIGLVMWGNNA